MLLVTGGMPGTLGSAAACDQRERSALTFLTDALRKHLQLILLVADLFGYAALERASDDSQDLHVG
jgi:hypothetical protein